MLQATDQEEPHYCSVLATRVGITEIWSEVVMLFVLRRAPMAVEGGLSELQHLLGVGREDTECGRSTTKGVLLMSAEIGMVSDPDNW